MKIAFTLIFILASLFTSTAQSPTLFTSDRDNTLYESVTGALSNGTGSWMFSGKTGPQSALLRRAVMHFNISSLASNVVIDSVKLDLTLVNNSGNGSQVHNLHRITSSWGEGTTNAPGQEGGGAAATTNSATWLHRFSTTMSWTLAGGDYITAPSGSVTIGITNGVYSPLSSPGMLSDIQAWHTNSANNHGWILIGNEAANSTAKRFCTRENTGIPPCVPLLTVYWHTPPLKLSFFDVELNKGEALIKWVYDGVEELTEIRIEHARENSNFKAFKILTKNELSENGIEHFNDLNFGANYFRMVFVSPDGAEEISAIKAFDLEERSDVKVFPNPTMGIIILEITGESKLVRSEIFNLEGRLLLKNNNQKTINIESLSAGIYFIKVYVGNETYIKRIMKI